MSRVQLEISLGILFVALTSALLIWYGLNEPKRMAEYELHQRAKAIEVGAELYDINCKGCHGPQGEGVVGLWPPLNDRHFFTNRLTEVGWSGTLEDYIISTVSSGRLVSTRPDLYPGQGRPVMPAWAERYGGPLRDDQIRNLAAFILNWKDTAPDRTAQMAEMAGPPTGTDINKQLPEGDPVRGQGLAAAKGCAVCHISAPTGPAWLATPDQPGIATRAEEILTDPNYTGNAKTAAQYLHESIVLPNVYIVPGFQAGVMPANYGDTLTDQELADIIAYLLTLK
ncbi:MAG: cytochrome c [Anaerolineales bacterium]|nr:cytochrome c [Anaerolineales bacterium]MCS7247911.1 cytochrome c [Anaerolineales bacterium]MDW8161721.1 cytochrome c [Anaerolineales bacterium]MDW8447207.1 cytochrome c [Anaerolineales bacterium]